MEQDPAACRSMCRSAGPSCQLTPRAAAPGAAVHLTPKAYELLRLLLERRPAAVSKAGIHDRIWPGTFVSDVNLATLAFEIRTAIGDDPQAQ